MNGAEFLTGLPQLPSYQEAVYASSPIWDNARGALEAAIGAMVWEERTFLGNSGGASTDDSFRGFGATSQHYRMPTTKGWTVLYNDNPGIVVTATSPEGVVWERRGIIDNARVYCRRDVMQQWIAQKNAAIKARKTYLEEATRERIDTKYPGFYIQRERVRYEACCLFSLSEETDNLFSEESSEPTFFVPYWWNYKSPQYASGITIQELF